MSTNSSRAIDDFAHGRHFGIPISHDARKIGHRGQYPAVIFTVNFDAERVNENHAAVLS